MEIIAHRGASGYAPENTLAAFKKAIEMGAKSIEFDVQMTKDEELVVIHDYTLDRTTNGSGYVMDMTLEEIRTYDAGSWFGSEFEGERVPLLGEVLDLFTQDMEIHLEIKKFVFEKREVERKVVELLLERNQIHQTVISSFDHECLKNVSKLVNIKIGVLIASRLLNPADYLSRNGLKNHSINQSDEFVNESLLKEAHENGLKVLSYTVNDYGIAKKFEEIGVDAVFSNYPDILINK